MFTLFDIIILAVVGLSSISGLIAGSVRLIIGMISFCISILLSIVLFPLAQDIFEEYISSHGVVNILSSSISYIISIIICAITFRKIKKVASPLCGSGIDRIIGIILGFLRGFCIGLIGFVIAIAISTSIKTKPKNGLMLLKNIDSKHYPNWLKSSFTLNIFNNITIDISTQLLKSEEAKNTLKSIEFNVSDENDKQDKDNKKDEDNNFSEELKGFLKNNITK